MPADDTLSQAPSSRHGNGDKPYPCFFQPTKPIADWAIDYGYCRHSLDLQQPESRAGSTDPRCPDNCAHRAPPDVVLRFMNLFNTEGNKAAAEMALKHKQNF